MKKVSTIIGELSESDLESFITEQDCGDTLIVSREWKYKGIDPLFAEHVGQVVRRDVWVTLKTGISATSSAEF